MNAPDKPSLWSWLPGFLALALIWGASFLFIKVGIRELHPLYVTLGRVSVGALTLLALLGATRDRLPRDLKLWGHLAVVAAVGVATPFTLFGYGEQRIPTVLAGIWNATTPLVVLPMAVLVFRTERMNSRRATGLVLGFIGVLVVLGAWQGASGGSFIGQLLCFAAAACYGVVIPYQKRFILRHDASGVALAAGQLVMATVQLAVIAPLVAGPPAAPWRLSPEVIASVLVLGALGSGLSFVVNLRNIKLVGASTASMVTYLIPVVAVLIGVLVLDERLTWYQPVGAAIVLAGVAISQTGAANSPRTDSPGPDSPDPSSPDPDGRPRTASDADAVPVSDRVTGSIPATGQRARC